MRLVIFELGLLAVFSCMLMLFLPQPHVQLPPPPPPVIVSSQSGPTIEKLQRLSHLATSRVYVVDVLIGETDNCRGAWLIRGDALLAVDLNRAQVTERNEKGKNASVVLPSPEVLQPRVDHEKTKTWEVRSLAWLPWTTDESRLRDAVMLHAQRLVAQAAGSKENIEQAKRAAEAIIRALYSEVGWDVKVIWQQPQDVKPAAVLDKNGQH